ncbi:hypothetical protein Curi_c13520 [Gottschalkia acidurici 9a]|uniref:Uncharacterized protein n=2 Tax=Clostridium acidurici TaxID=1556 RepID=K0AZZ9_GOTA9|nr:hypothetical protein Curi_c13520 [Gottschalkia acidurici 9a]
MEELQERIDEAHAHLIMNRINNLNWSYEDKIALVKQIRGELKRRGEQKVSLEAPS